MPSPTALFVLKGSTCAEEVAGGESLVNAAVLIMGGGVEGAGSEDEEGRVDVVKAALVVAVKGAGRSMFQPTMAIAPIIELRDSVVVASLHTE